VWPREERGRENNKRASLETKRERGLSLFGGTVMGGGGRVLRRKPILGMKKKGAVLEAKIPRRRTKREEGRKGSKGAYHHNTGSPQKRGSAWGCT